MAELTDDQKAMVNALWHLQFATPRERNGPVYQAADCLRIALGLSPMTIGGRTTDGLEKIVKSVGIKTEFLSS